MIWETQILEDGKVVPELQVLDFVILQFMILKWNKIHENMRITISYNLVF